MKEGTHVVLRHGTKVYRAYRDIANSDWRYVYTLVPVDGGRKRYRVDAEQMRPYTPERVPPVETSRGSVKRPKGFRKLPEYSGCTRHTYVGKQWVYKLSRLDRGERQNQVEAALWLLQSSKIGYTEKGELVAYDL